MFGLDYTTDRLDLLAQFKNKEDAEKFVKDCELKNPRRGRVYRWKSLLRSYDEVLIDGGAHQRYVEREPMYGQLPQ